MSKIKSREELADIVDKLKKEGKTIVTTNGAFDILHTGHIKSLKFAKKHGDIVIVGLNSDSSIKKYKSEKRPIIPEKQRAEVLSSVQYVDYIIVFEEKTPVGLLKQIKPDIHIKGSEYKGKMPEKDVVEKHGGRVVFIEREEEGVSTTKIIEKILQLGEPNES